MRAAQPVALALLVAGVVASCKTGDDSAAALGDDGGTDAGESVDAAGPADAAAPIDAGADAKTYPLAKGDPCRGTPLPDDQHYVAPGLCARIVLAPTLNPLRELTFAPNGDLFAVSRDGNVFLHRDQNGDGVYQPEEIHLWATTDDALPPLERLGNNVHIDGGYLYSGNVAGVVRWPYDPKALAASAPAEPVVVNQPSDGHPLHTVHVYDGWLYVVSGSYGDGEAPLYPEYDTNRALVRRFKLSSFVPGSPFDWLSGEIYSLGLRNMNGFTRNAAGRMYGVVNGMDFAAYEDIDQHQDNPGEQVVRLELGRKFGWPYCWTAQRVVLTGLVIQPGTQLRHDTYRVHDDAWCAANSTKPVTFTPAHSAPLDIQFFDDHPTGALPEKWRGGAFITLHGSTHRDIPTGYKVVWVPFDAAGNSPLPTSTTTETKFPHEVVLGGGTKAGAVDGPWTWTIPTPNGPMTDGFRPVGVAIHPIDGALYVSTDSNGAIYRVGVKK